MICKHRVGVMRGGPSGEYDVSIKTGANVLRSLRENLNEKYDVHDILIDRDGVWNIDGLKVSLNDLFHRVDVVFNALHGNYGEDGKVQYIFETHGIPITGSGSLASAIGMSKSLSKKAFLDHDIVTPRAIVVTKDEITNSMENLYDELFNSLILPVVVKPENSGSSLGVSIVKWYRDLPTALILANKYSENVLIEDYIKGVEATCGVIDNFRGEEIYALPPVEIMPEKTFFDYEAKYGDKSREIVPASFGEKIKTMIQETAKKIHRVLGMKHYSRTDFIVHPQKGIYALEVNSLPGLTDQSLLPKSLQAIGCDMSQFVDHVIGLALKR